MFRLQGPLSGRDVWSLPGAAGLRILAARGSRPRAVVEPGCEEALKFDHDLCPSGVEDCPGFQRHVSISTVSSTLSRMINIACWALVNPRRRHAG